MTTLESSLNAIQKKVEEKILNTIQKKVEEKIQSEKQKKQLINKNNKTIEIPEAEEKPKTKTTQKTNTKKVEKKEIHFSGVIVFNPKTEEFSMAININGEPETATASSLSELLEYQASLIKSKFAQKTVEKKPKTTKNKTNPQNKKESKPLSLF